jgi:cytochrome c-type biogenesis protein CcmH
MNWMRALLLLFLLAMPAFAVSPDEVLADPVLEHRARDISAGLRCLVCQNQSIDDSDADLAKDLRVLVRERLVAGDSDEQVRQYLVDRYGEFVLLNPRINNHTILLWIAAPTLLILGLGTLIVLGRRRRVVVDGLSREEQAALDELK